MKPIYQNQDRLFRRNFYKIMCSIPFELQKLKSAKNKDDILKKFLSNLEGAEKMGPYYFNQFIKTMDRCGAFTYLEEIEQNYSRKEEKESDN